MILRRQYCTPHYQSPCAFSSSTDFLKNLAPICFFLATDTARIQPFIYFGSAGVLLTTKIDFDVEWFKVNRDELLIDVYGVCMIASLLIQK